MRKILYIHGYRGSANGSSINNLKKYLPEGYTIEGIDYPETRCEEALYSIAKYINENNIDIIIGSSLGAFLAMNLPTMPRMIVNPCYLPTVELPKINADSNYVESFAAYENEFEIPGIHNTCAPIIGFFSTDDELLGRQYVNRFSNVWGSPNGVINIKPGHHISEDSAKIIMKSLCILENKITQYNKSKV